MVFGVKKCFGPVLVDAEETLPLLSWIYLNWSWWAHSRQLWRTQGAKAHPALRKGRTTWGLDGTAFHRLKRKQNLGSLKEQGQCLGTNEFQCLFCNGDLIRLMILKWAFFCLLAVLNVLMPFFFFLNHQQHHHHHQTTQLSILGFIALPWKQSKLLNGLDNLVPWELLRRRRAVFCLVFTLSWLHVQLLCALLRQLSGWRVQLPSVDSCLGKASALVSGRVEFGCQGCLVRVSGLPLGFHLLDTWRKMTDRGTQFHSAWRLRMYEEHRAGRWGRALQVLPCCCCWCCCTVIAGSLFLSWTGSGGS